MSRARFFLFSMTWMALVAMQAACFAQDPYAGTAADRESLARTGSAIRDAFARGDIDTILAYHHPDVIKALAYNRFLVGKDAVRKDLEQSLQANRLDFKENRVESVFFQGVTAVEESSFAIRGTPKNGSAPFLFKGRSMVVYVRYKGSPTGWASIREIIQPAD